jgi:hypothetical protein
MILEHDGEDYDAAPAAAVDDDDDDDDDDDGGGDDYDECALTGEATDVF